MPADAKCEPVVATDQAQLEMIGNALQNSNFNLGTGGQNPAQNPMIITIQYKGKVSLKFGSDKFCLNDFASPFQFFQMLKVGKKPR